MQKNQSVVVLNRTLKWLDKTEGRDKFCKAIQYACRYLKYKYTQQGNKQMAKKVDALFNSMKDARKLFRLFKSFKQLSKLLDVLAKKDIKNQDLILNIITRIGFLLYWIFDNLAILSKIKIISMDTKSLAKRGSTFWFIALLSTFILTIKNVIIELRKDAHSKKLRKDIIALIKTIGDMLPAGQGCQFYPNALGFNVNEGFCGIGGLISALISSYELYE